MNQYIHFGRQGTERRDTGRNIQERMRTEVCIPIDEEDGWRSWFWFPGRSLSATAHWWVKEGDTELIGDWVGPSDDYGHKLHENRMQHPMMACVFADGDWDSSMVLPMNFRASLIPRFAVGVAQAGDCNRVKIDEDIIYGEAVWHRLETTEVCAKWMIAQLVAELNQPEDFLRRLAAVFPTAEKIGWIPAWLNLYLPFIAHEPRRG